MAIPIGKIAPTVAIAAMVAYCTWPHLVGLDLVGKQPENRKLPEISGLLLSPTIAEPPERDPFQPLPIAPNVAAHDDEAKSADGPAHATVSDDDEIGPGERLVLNGTLLRGERRLAVINGKLYATGEPLRAADSIAASYRITQIDLDKVVLHGPGRPVELRYLGLAPAGGGPAQSQATSTLPSGTCDPAKRSGANLSTSRPASKQHNKTKPGMP